MRVVRWLSPDEFANAGEGTVRFGTAPDGMPWVTQIPASKSGAALLAAADSVFSLRGAAPDFAGTPLHEIVLSLDALIRRHYVHEIHAADGGVFSATVLPRPVNSLLGPSLLQRFLDRSMGSGTQTGSSLGPATGAAAEEPSVPRFRPGDACLAFPDQGERLSIVHMTHNHSGWPSFTFRRSFVHETLQAFDEGEFCFFEDGRRVAELAAVGMQSYLDRRRDSPWGHWRFRTSRTSLGWKVAAIAKAAYELHSADEIHGDIKPANVLLGGREVHLIDSLHLREGVHSPALTRGWAAPEQVMAAEVTASTDQFPIGLMLLALVQGVLFGEETTVVVPSGGARTERHSIFRSPGVFIDPDNGTVEKARIRPWQKLIERCLRFPSADRFPSIRDLLAELEPLLKGDSLIGWGEIPLRFGHAMTGLASSGDETPVWLAG